MNVKIGFTMQGVNYLFEVVMDLDFHYVEKICRDLPHGGGGAPPYSKS